MKNFEVSPEYIAVSEFVDETFLARGFDTRRLSDFDLQTPQHRAGEKEVIGHTIHGDIEEAETIILVSGKYLTPLKAPHYQLLLEGYQTALGSEYCVVGAEQYPNDKSTKRDGISNYSDFSEDTIKLIDALGTTHEQRMVLSGYSLGADISIKVARDLLEDQNKGIRPIDGVYATEIVRTADRSTWEVIRDNIASTKHLADRAKEAKVRALIEAWGGNPDGRKTRLKKAAGTRAIRGLVGYLKEDFGANRAILSSFGDEESVLNLEAVARARKIPRLCVMKYDDSLLFDEIAFRRLSNNPSIEGYRTAGNHLAGDNIRRAAAHMLYLVKKSYS